MFVSKFIPALILGLPVALFAADGSISQVSDTGLIVSTDSGFRHVALSNLTLQPACRRYKDSHQTSFLDSLQGLPIKLEDEKWLVKSGQSWQPLEYLLVSAGYVRPKDSRFLNEYLASLLTKKGRMQCETALHAFKGAAAANGIDPFILYAISLTEAQYQGGVWPWTINIEGKPRYFDTREEAIEFAKTMIASNRIRMDVGPMQLHWAYHAHRFNSIDEAFDIDKNIRAGARYLAELKATSKNWGTAIARYHAGTNTERGIGYVQRVINNLKKISL
jgi:hypothetical protein